MILLIFSFRFCVCVPCYVTIHVSCGQRRQQYLIAAGKQNSFVSLVIWSKFLANKMSQSSGRPWQSLTIHDLLKAHIIFSR